MVDGALKRDVPITSATNMDQLAELTAAANVTLDADDIAKIDEAKVTRPSSSWRCGAGFTAS